MSKIIPSNQKHMTLDDHISIKKGLEQCHSLCIIALALGKDPTTISKKHRTFHEHNHFNEPRNKCSFFKDCKKKNICQTYSLSAKKCAGFVITATPIAPISSPRSYHCSMLAKAPFVCNGCVKKTGCRMDKVLWTNWSAPLFCRDSPPYMILQNHLYMWNLLFHSSYYNFSYI